MKMKKIDVKEMGKLPEGWKRVKVGEVLEEIKERNNKNDYNIVFTVSNKYGLVIQSEFFNRLLASKDKRKYKVVKKYYFAYNPARINVGSISLNKFNQTGIISPMYVVFKVKENILSPLYFEYHTKRSAFNIKVISSTSGSVRETLNYEALKDFDFLLPPFPEQRKIAEILETVDNAIEKTDKIIEKYKRIKQGLMQDLLTKGVDENWNIRSEKIHKFKDSPLGKVSEEWEVMELGEISTITMGQSPKSSLVNKEEKGLPFLQGNAEFSNFYPIPINWIELPLKIAYKNSILMSVRAPVGALNMANENYCIGRGLASVSPNNDKIKLKFLWYNLQFNISQLIKAGQGSTFEAIGSKELQKYNILLPPLPEQYRIASILSQIDETIEKEQKYKEKLERLKQGLMEDFLTSKVRVNHLINEVEENVHTA